jgi:hypothetical protein
MERHRIVTDIYVNHMNSGTASECQTQGLANKMTSVESTDSRKRIRLFAVAISETEAPTSRECATTLRRGIESSARFERGMVMSCKLQPTVEHAAILVSAVSIFCSNARPRYQEIIKNAVRAWIRDSAVRKSS